MSLIRGFGGLFPCPTCFVPAELLLCHSPEGFERRTAAGSEDIVIQASEMPLAKDRERLLKEHGLRGIDVCLFFPRR
jgi:hypothetical protein